jgi:hypothetical protein
MRSRETEKLILHINFAIFFTPFSRLIELLYKPKVSHNSHIYSVSKLVLIIH